jgi:hypothetical protein
VRKSAFSAARNRESPPPPEAGNATHQVGSIEIYAIITLTYE